MTVVFLGVGSNVDRDANVVAGLEALHAAYGITGLSPVYESDAVGFSGDAFLNLVVSLESDLELEVLARQLRELEYRMGRPLDASPFSARTLDIDILTYGDAVGVISGVQLPREEITRNAFVLRPLAELAPDAIHPVVGASYASLWAAYPAAQQPLRRVSFQWGDRQL